MTAEFGHTWFAEMMMNRFDKSLSPYWGCLFLAILFQPLEAQADTYYVAISGNDSNLGTLNQPWRHPQRCVAQNSPLQAGDVCSIGPGTYTDTDGDGITVYIRSTAPSGTASQPITLRSEVPLAAVIIVPSLATPNAGIHISRSNYVIEGFSFTGGTGTAGTTAIGVWAVSNVTIRRNEIHHIGWGVCADHGNSYSGTLVKSASTILIEENTYHHIGRLRNGENGCKTERYQHDHGIYDSAASNLTIRRNVFYEITRGYALQVYNGAGDPHRNVFFYNNIISGKSPTGSPVGQIVLCNTLENVQIKNNIFYNPTLDYAIHYCAIAPKATGLIISHNLTNGIRENFQNPNSQPLTGVTYLSNKTNIDPKFADAKSHDYRLLSTSPAIDSGTNVGLPYKGSAPDIGAYEFSEQDDKGPLRPIDVRIQ